VDSEFANRSGFNRPAFRRSGEGRTSWAAKEERKVMMQQWSLALPTVEPEHRREQIQQHEQITQELDPIRLHEGLFKQFKQDLRNWANIGPVTREEWREWVAASIPPNWKSELPEDILERLRSCANQVRAFGRKYNRWQIRREMHALIEIAGAPVPFSFAMCCMVHGANPLLMQESTLERIGWPGTECGPVRFDA